MEVTTAQERDFEIARILRLRERYLASDVIEKVRNDPGYAEKVSLIEGALEGTRDTVLDVGANTCGESEYLVTRGYRVIANDVNPEALKVSGERCARFGRPAPEYLVADAQQLPLQDESIGFVVFNESLHHMPDPKSALKHAARVLKQGGKLYLYEPYAFDPYRRMSEIRDRFRGTIEKSFSVTQLKRLVTNAGLEVVSCNRHVCAVSTWKLGEIGKLHCVLRRVYVAISKRALWLFGNIVMIAEKRKCPN